MRIIILIAIVIITVTACGGGTPPEIPEQEKFNSKFISDKTTDAQIDQLRSERSHIVKNWDAYVDNVREDGPFTIIDARYHEQKYHLFLFENEAKKNGMMLTKNSHLIFSGDLGPEQSITRFGARSAPEFEFYPTSVVSGAMSITQDPLKIADQEREDLSRQQKAADEKEQQRQNEAIDSSIETQVVDLCRKAVLQNLRYPASGKFSWFKKQVSKETDTKWVYQDVINSKNAFGADLPSRFVCTVTIKGQKMRASVQFLDQ